MPSGDLYANVLLPLPVPGTYTYSIPEEMYEEIQPGKRVVVQFGRRKVYTALVRLVHNKKPTQYTAKSILSVLDEFPVVNEIQFGLWEWIAEYYICFPGEVMNAALPSGLKLASESVICLNESAEIDPDVLNEKELMVLETLQVKKKATVSEISGITEMKKIIPLVNNLLEKGLIYTEEELQDKYTPRIETFVRLTQSYREDEENLKDVFDELSSKAYKQLELLLSYINLSRENEGKFRDVKRVDLLKSINAQPTSLNALVKKGIMELFDQETSRLESRKATSDPENIILTEHQKRAFHFLFVIALKLPLFHEGKRGDTPARDYFIGQNRDVY